MHAADPRQCMPAIRYVLKWLLAVSFQWFPGLDTTHIAALRLTRHASASDMQQDVVNLTTCASVIFLYQGVSSTGIGFIVGDKFAGSINGFDRLSGPKGFATRFAPWLEPPKGELADFDRSLPAKEGTAVGGLFLFAVCCCCKHDDIEA